MCFDIIQYTSRIQYTSEMFCICEKGSMVRVKYVSVYLLIEDVLLKNDEIVWILDIINVWKGTNFFLFQPCFQNVNSAIFNIEHQLIYDFLCI